MQPQRTPPVSIGPLTPPRALALLTALFSAALIAGGSFKYARWGQGFDMVDFHMPIWGTLHGHFLLVSRYNFTDTFLGLDLALGFLPAIPFYALAPSAYTLVVVQVLLLASGAIPVYLIAKERIGSPWAGVAFAAAYLLYPTTQFMAMAGPFQPRIPGLVGFLWAFWFLQRRQLLPYLAALFLAMLSRTDAALVVLAFGLYAGWGWVKPGRSLRPPRLTHPHPGPISWPFAIIPIVVSLIYFYVAITYVAPLFYSGNFVPGRVDLPFDLSRDYNDLWPCGVSPQACYYLHLGSGIPGIIRNIISHPIAVFLFVFQPDKLWYLTLMLGGMLFLPLFAPRELLLAAPIFAINMLSNRIYQYVITEQYQILAIPGVVIAAIYGGAWLWEQVGGRGRPVRPPRPHRSARPPTRYALIGLVLLVALLNIPLRNPVLSAFRNPETAERVALMERMRAMIPPDATVAATSFLAPHLLPRLELYYIPGGKMHHQVDEAEYAFLDLRASGLRDQAARGNDIVGRLRADPRWTVLYEEDELVLFRRAGQ